jgi:hypothetical protein
VPHRPILAKFRLGFWQIVCPGHRGTVPVRDERLAANFSAKIASTLVFVHPVNLLSTAFDSGVFLGDAFI